MESQGFEGDDFFPSLEPMVIINSQDDEDDDHDNFGADGTRDSWSCLAKPPNDDSTPRLEPEISIFPVNRKQPSTFKIKLFGNGFKNHSATSKKSNKTTESKNTGSRAPVRLVSKDEAMKAAEPYTKRKSSPLAKCPLCKKFFKRMKTHLMKHQVLENQEQCSTLICEICKKAFNNHSNLQIHMRTHTGDKPYVCVVCNKSFSQSCNLVNHVRIHTGEKPFACPYCDKAFTQSGNLNNHIRLHTDEKPFRCHFCEKAFTQSGNLNSHIRNNHKYKNSNALLANFHQANEKSEIAGIYAGLQDNVNM
ncbi:hypothetical protein HUJ04_006168 [Dendroctonus ponderosae]